MGWLSITSLTYLLAYDNNAPMAEAAVALFILIKKKKMGFGVGAIVHQDHRIDKQTMQH
jgi:hypothetical protein